MAGAMRVSVQRMRLLGGILVPKTPLLSAPYSLGLPRHPFLNPNLRASGFCDVAHALKAGDDGLLKGIKDKEILEEVKRLLEMETLQYMKRKSRLDYQCIWKGRRALSRRETIHSDFLTPPVLKEATAALEKLSDAERCRLSIGHIDDFHANPDVVAALSISGNFEFEPCSHGDFLGAILGTGITREKLGDIILQGEKGAQALVVPELVEFLESSLQKVGSVPVSCTKMPLLALEFLPPRTKTLKTIEASLRVDAVASAGFQISRTKLGNMISSGDVRVNWTPVTKSGTTLKTGDMVSVSGKGRLKIGEITTTRKGKYAIELIRYF
ncbi:putative RNA-binding protein [Nymphaea thermarum]|nr:putative RNA-binding protein [Nymphaea thermarum]